ncbi:MAG: M56 family metallopeptidase, partial [Phycisphaerae bacterium]
MNQSINTCITGLNNIGQGFWNYAAGIFIQSSVLIVLLLIVDSLLRKRVRAVFRYCLWMLVFIKLVMPASFTLPTGIGYWMGDYFPSEVSMSKWIPQTEEIVPTTLNIHQRSIPLEPVVTNETAVIDIYQGLSPLEPAITNETAASGIELEHICWQGLVFLGWLVGMLVLLVLLVKRVCFVRGLIAQSRPANGRLLEMLDECRCLIGIRQNIELRLSGNRLSPADCGLFKPIILMPATLPKKLSREKLKAVLIHELAHIKRGDVWVNLLQTTLQIVYFYNPFVWLANAMVRRVREQAVDEMVLVTLKPETKSYSNMLIDIAEMAFWRPNFSLRLIGVVESKKALERRIKHMLSRPVPKSSKLGYLGLIAIIVIGAILLPMGSNSMAEAANIQKISRVHSETKTIVPGVGVGDYTLGMSKDEVLRKLGEPEEIFFAGERYTLDNLPKRYFMSFGDISFRIDNDTVKGITAISPYYKFTNGLGVGDSEKEIKQAFGDDLHLEEGRGRDFLVYKDKGLHFEIHKMDRTVMEINVTQAKHNQQSDRVSGKDVLNLIRQAAAEGRIAYKRTTPEEFKQIAGKPTEEQVSEDGEVVELEYSGIQVKFFGKPNLNKPVTILWIAYDGGNIDIGKDRYQKTVKVPSVQRFDKEQGKNPGLGIRRLHEKGITGRGVRIAILDQKLLVDHQEYAERVRLYEEIDLRARMNPQMHGAAVASIALGKTVGVAPEAELYYIAKKGGPRYVAQGINRILKINEQLPKDNKIRVISISVGWTPSVDSYEDNMAACERAKAAGIFVVSCSLEEVYGFSFHGLGRDPSADPDLFESYEPGLWWAKEFYEGTELRGSDCLLVPMDSRTTASPGGKDKYVFHREGGWSWSVPYIAGVYALAAQVEPDITPKRFWNLALKTGRTIQLEHEGEKRPFGLMIDPVRLIHSISDDEAASQQVTSKHTIVPGLRVGDYTLDMSKDEVLRKLGEPESIQLGEDEIVRRGEEKYNLNNLPRHY